MSGSWGATRHNLDDETLEDEALDYIADYIASSGVGSVRPDKHKGNRPATKPIEPERS